jgi:predicted enzyme related to lactoylglutathione lyase
MGDENPRGLVALPLPTHFECIDPILRVEDMARSLRDDVEVLGFESAPWGNPDFTRVERDGRGIYLSRGGQGRGGAWVWIGVADVRALYRVYRERGAVVLQKPKNEPWALEMRIADPDGNVLRFGSDREDLAEYDAR